MDSVPIWLLYRLIYITNISSVTSVIDMATVEDKEQLKYLNTTPLQPSSFGGVNPLIEHSKLDKTVVQKWLPYQDTISRYPCGEIMLETVQ